MTSRGLAPELQQALQSRGLTIERTLGEGGMATVWLARSTTGDALAIKVPSDESPRTIERFQREAEVTRALADVPGVVHGVSGSLAPPRWLGLEFIPGETLQQRLGRGPIDELELLELLAAVADTLALAHERGIIHRDLKGSNILIDERDGRPRLADFGVARALAAESLTKTGELVGSVHTMAPEQISGERGAIGPATDLWALGVLLYEGLSGTPPFTGETSATLAAAICRATPPPISESCKSLRSGTRELIAACLRPSPAERLADASEFAERCRRAAEQEPAAPERDTRRPMLLALGLAVLLAALAAGLFTIHSLRRRAEARRDLHELAGRLRATLRDDRARYEDWLEKTVLCALVLDPRPPRYTPSEDLARLHRLIAIKLEDPPRTADEDALAAGSIWRIARHLCGSETALAPETPGLSEADRRIARLSALAATVRAERFEEARSMVPADSDLADRLAIHISALEALRGLISGEDVSADFTRLDEAARDRQLGEFTARAWRALSQRELKTLKDPARVVAIARRADRHAATLTRLGGLGWTPEALAAIVDRWTRNLQTLGRPPTPDECEQLARQLDRGPTRAPVDIPIRDRRALHEAILSVTRWPSSRTPRSPLGVPTLTLASVSVRLCSVGVLIDPIFYALKSGASPPAWLKTGCFPSVAEFLRHMYMLLAGHYRQISQSEIDPADVKRARSEMLSLLRQPLPGSLKSELLMLLCIVESNLCRGGLSMDWETPRRIAEFRELLPSHPRPYRTRVKYAGLLVGLAVDRGLFKRRVEGMELMNLDLIDLGEVLPEAAKLIADFREVIAQRIAKQTAIPTPEDVLRRLESDDPEALSALKDATGKLKTEAHTALMILLELRLRRPGPIPAGLVEAVRATETAGVALKTSDVTMDLVEREIYRERIAARNGEPISAGARGITLKVPSVKALLDILLAMDRARAAESGSGQ